MGCEALATKAEVEQLRQQIAKLKPIDEQKIINQAVNQASLLFDPRIAAVQASAFGAYKLGQSALSKTNVLGNSLDNLRYGFNSLGQRVNTVSNVANSTRASIDSLGRNVINNSNRLGALQSKLVNLDIRLGGALSRIGALAAAVAGIATRLLNILSIIGAVAGLISLAGTLYAIIPRLDAQERYIDSVNKTASNAYSLGSSNKLAIRDTNAKLQATTNTANSAYARANEAFSSAGVANVKANQATNLAAGALSIGQNALNLGSRALNGLLQISAVVGTISLVAYGARSLANLAVAACKHKRSDLQTRKFSAQIICK